MAARAEARGSLDIGDMSPPESLSSEAFAVLLGVGALLSAGRFWFHLVATRLPGDRSWQTDVLHFVMNATMAVMLTKLYSGAVIRAIDAIYLCMALVLGILVLREIQRTGRREQRILSGAVYSYHFIASVAMLYAIEQMHPIDGIVGMPMREGLGHMPALLLLIVLGFATDLLATILIFLFFPAYADAFVVPSDLSNSQMAADPGASRMARMSLLDADRGKIVPHLIMDAGMVWMLTASV